MRWRPCSQKASQLAVVVTWRSGIAHTHNLTEGFTAGCDYSVLTCNARAFFRCPCVVSSWGETPWLQGIADRTGGLGRRAVSS